MLPTSPALDYGHLLQAQEISARYGVLKEDAGVDLRGLFIINPEGGVEHITMNGPSVGRNVDEAKRLVQAIQFVAEYGEVHTPAEGTIFSAARLQATAA